MKNNQKCKTLQIALQRSIELLILLFVQISFSVAYSQTSNITLQEKNKTVKEILDKIEKQTKLVFFYNDKDIDINRRVTINQKNQPISVILTDLLKNTTNSFKIDGNQVFLTKKAGTATEEKKQPATKRTKIEGTIKDEAGEFVIGAAVVVLGTTNGTTTDINGNFSLDVPETGQLQVSYVGYEPRIITIDRNLSYNISINPSRQLLEDVVVVGYGTQKKVSVIGAISTIKSEQLGVTSKVNLSQSLAGNIPGIIAVQRTGELGNDKADFWIRGISTFAKGGASQPLIIVDGVERDFNAIDPQEIESFSVMKDASATAVYGVRGANGVIAITTKKGEVGLPRINLNYESSFRSPTVVPKFVDAAEYMTIANRANSMGGGVGNLFSEERILNTKNRIDPDLYPDVNWVNELLKSFTNYNRINLNISGGAPKVRYFVSASYHHEGGLYKTATDREWDSNIQLNKINFRTNLDINLTSTTDVNLNIGSQLQMLNGPITSADDLWRSMIEVSPNLIPLRYSDGQLSTPTVGTNPYNWMTQYGYKKSADNALNATASVSQKLDVITKGLSARLIYAYDVNTYNNLYGKFLPEMFTASGRDAEGNLIGTTKEGSPFLDKSKSSAMDYNTYLEANINYDRTFGDHQLGGLFLYNQKEYNVASGSGEYTVLPYQNQGIAGRLTYNYKSRYFIEGNFGLNGSENFAQGKRFGFFPAVAMGWYISEESFWKNLKDVVSKLKIRGSYGIVGNDKLGVDAGGSNIRFAYITEVAPGGSYNFGSVSTYNPVYGTTEGKFGSPDLTWETETKRDIGLEIGLLNNTLELNIDYFNNDRKDIFTQRRIIPATAGFNQAPWANLGKMNNKGFDFNFVYRLSETRESTAVPIWSWGKKDSENMIEDNETFVTAGGTGYYIITFDPVTLSYSVKSDTGVPATPEEEGIYSQVNNLLYKSGNGWVTSNWNFIKFNAFPNNVHRFYVDVKTNGSGWDQAFFGLAAQAGADGTMYSVVGGAGGWTYTFDGFACSLEKKYSWAESGQISEKGSMPNGTMFRMVVDTYLMQMSWAPISAYSYPAATN